MKTLPFLLAGALLIHINGAELLVNGDFESGTMDHWYVSLPSDSDSIQLMTTDSGIDLHVSLAVGGGLKIGDVRIWQPIVVQAGNRYVFQFCGRCDVDIKKINFGIGHNGSTGNGGDGSGDFTDYKHINPTLIEARYYYWMMEWYDSTVDDSAACFYVEAGGNDIDFYFAWASVEDFPINAGRATCFQTHPGFFTDGSKRIVVKGARDSSFQIRDSTGAVLFSGLLGPSSNWSPSGDTVRLADFSSLESNVSGALYCRNQNAVRGDFSISSHPLRSIALASLKAYYYQRASTALTSACAGTWARAAGHPDTAVIVHASAGSGKVAAPKGWYDAGDYGKYMISSGITVYTLLALYEHFPRFMAGLELTIPESGDTVPDILDEVRWNLEWMLSMQAADGGVYSKLTPLEFDGFIMPDESTESRYVFMKTTPAALDFAAVTAMSARLYKSFDETFAGRCLEAAKKAYAWAAANPSVKYVQPAACNTGEYGDTVFSDEFFWASAELALAAGSGEYTYHTTNPLHDVGVPWWRDVGTLGTYTILTNMHVFPQELVENCSARLAAAADTLLVRQHTGFGISMTDNDFSWGSNSVAASQGCLFLYAYYLTGRTDYRAAAEQQIDYLLGRNPLRVCYVTGFGSKSPKHPHHRISEADNITAPVPGLLVGGSNPNGEDYASCDKNEYFDKPATSWLDDVCSFATNEVAINWNAPLAYCANALEALHNGDTAVGFRSVPTRVTPLHGAGAAKRTMTLSRRGNGILVRMTMHGEVAENGRCRIYNTLGKELARMPLVARSDGGGAFTEARVSTRGMAKGCVVVRMEAGASKMQRCFIVK